MFKKICASFLTIVLITSYYIPSSYAQDINALPKPGKMVLLSNSFAPAMIKGVTIDPQNPLKLNFLLDTGNQFTANSFNQEEVKKEAEKLIQFFLATLAIPEQDLWVNLSPYEKDRIVSDALSQTEMGQDLLAQDYLLKQISASLIYPNNELGRKFWDKVYAKMYVTYGKEVRIPVNTFNKVWIVADRAEVYERGQTAMVTKSRLKIMLEEDYLAKSKHDAGPDPVPPAGHPSPLTSSILREIIVPVLEEEVNTGKNFAPLRQIFHSIILAGWYKNNLKQAILNQIYSDKSNVNGIHVENKEEFVKSLYGQYVEAYKKGVFNLIQEQPDAKGAMVPRKYFSGGVDPTVALNPTKTSTFDVAMTGEGNWFSVDADLNVNSDAAMKARKVPTSLEEIRIMLGIEGIRDLERVIANTKKNVKGKPFAIANMKKLDSMNGLLQTLINYRDLTKQEWNLIKLNNATTEEKLGSQVVEPEFVAVPDKNIVMQIHPGTQAGQQRVTIGQLSRAGNFVEVDDPQWQRLADLLTAEFKIVDHRVRFLESSEPDDWSFGGYTVTSHPVVEVEGTNTIGYRVDKNGKFNGVRTISYQGKERIYKQDGKGVWKKFSTRKLDANEFSESIKQDEDNMKAYNLSLRKYRGLLKKEKELMETIVKMLADFFGIVYSRTSKGESTDAAALAMPILALNPEWHGARVPGEVVKIDRAIVVSPETIVLGLLGGIYIWNEIGSLLTPRKDRSILRQILNNFDQTNPQPISSSDFVNVYFSYQGLEDRMYFIAKLSQSKNSMELGKWIDENLISYVNVYVREGQDGKLVHIEPDSNLDSFFIIEFKNESAFLDFIKRNSLDWKKLDPDYDAAAMAIPSLAFKLASQGPSQEQIDQAIITDILSDPKAMFSGLLHGLTISILAWKMYSKIDFYRNKYFGKEIDSINEGHGSQMDIANDFIELKGSFSVYKSGPTITEQVYFYAELKERMTKQELADKLKVRSGSFSIYSRKTKYSKFNWHNVFNRDIPANSEVIISFADKNDSVRFKYGVQGLEAPVLVIEPDWAMAAQGNNLDQASVARSKDVQGGIDLKETVANTNVRLEGKGVSMTMTPELLASLKRDGIKSLVPVVVNIAPVGNLKAYLGL